MISYTMKKLLVVMIILFVATLAKAGVSLGGKVNTDNTSKNVFIVGDFNQWNLDREDMFGLSRFGYGQGRLEISDRLGVEAENRSGVLMGGHKLYKGSLEVASGKIGYKNNTVAYQWEPALGVGLKDSMFYAGLRAGISRTNLDQDQFVGSVISAKVFNAKITHYQNRYRTRDNLDVYDIILDNNFNVQKHVEYGNTEYIVGYKGEM